MGSRDKDQTAPHQPVLSSLVVRLSDSSGGGGGGVTGGSDDEPGELHREVHLHSRAADRFGGGSALNVAWYKNLGLEEGYRIRAGSTSPVSRRNPDHRHNSFDHSDVARNREFSSERDPGRYRNHSPLYGRGRGGSRSFGRGLDGPGIGPDPFRSEGIRNNPNVRPREGDWVCPDPICGNLNFARREQCNNCNRYRDGPGGSPQRGYLGPPPPRRFHGPPDRSPPGRTMNGGYRSPPRAWARDGPREFGGGAPSHRRHDGRFPDHNIRRDRLDYPEDDYRERNKFDRPAPPDWGHRDRGRDSFFSNERKGYERRPPSPPPPPPPPPPRDRWGRGIRARSRSPVRGGAPLQKDYLRDMYLERGRGDRHGIRRDRFGVGEPY